MKFYIRNFLKFSIFLFKELCLKLHSRTLASSHYKVSLEIYITLLEHLSEYFKERELEKRSLKASVDFLSNENSYLLKIVRITIPNFFFSLEIINQLIFFLVSSHKRLRQRYYQQMDQISRKVTEFVLNRNSKLKPRDCLLNLFLKSFIETIINETLKLFSIIGHDQKFGIYMTPVHFISLLDVQSNWFVKWMVSLRNNQFFLKF